MRIFLLLLLLAGSSESADSLRPWTEYRTILWISGSAWKKPDKFPLFLQRLKEMGVNSGMVTGDADGSAFVQAGLPYYVENIVSKGLCLKYSSPVTHWSSFIDDWMKKREAASFVRPYCLEDPGWLDWAKGRMKSVMKEHRAQAPLLADIRDELSVTISANPFDYDFSPQSLSGFRAWLKSQYASLEELNKGWDTDYASWEQVMPFSTDQIKARMVTGERMPKGPPDWAELRQVKFELVEAQKELVRWNFAPWADFRSYMDNVLARTLDALRQAGREADPATPIGIEGTQMPHAFGGYDLWKLSQSLDWMEPYDVGCSREILGSFMPHAPFMTTVFEKDTEHALRRLWHLLLEGDKGCIVWWSEDCVDLSKDDYPLMAKAKALAPAFAELTSPLARLFLKAEREYDFIAIHYSQASIQCAWLLESTEDGRTWPRRFSSFESQHSRHAAIREAWLKSIQDQGFSPRFVSTEQIEAGELARGNYRTLILPESWAISDREWKQIHAWEIAQRGWERGSTMAWQGYPGAFAGNGRLRAPQEIPADSVGSGFASTKSMGVVMDRSNGSGWQQSAVISASASAANTKEALAQAGELATEALSGLTPRVRYPKDLSVRVHRYHLGSAQLLAFERNVHYHMSEKLKQEGGNEALEKPADFIAKLARKTHVYDLRSRSYLGETDNIHVSLDPWKPSLYALLSDKLPEGADPVAALSETR